MKESTKFGNGKPCPTRYEPERGACFQRGVSLRARRWWWAGLPGVFEQAGAGDGAAAVRK